MGLFVLIISRLRIVKKYAFFTLKFKVFGMFLIWDFFSFCLQLFAFRFYVNNRMITRDLKDVIPQAMLV